MTFLFVSGMFRSGSTLLARLLNAHPAICVASDPFAAVFKQFRCDVARGIGQDVAFAEPLHDYYFSPDGLTLFRAVQRASFDLSFDPAALPQLRERVRAGGEPYSPLLMPHLDALAGATYAELLEAMVALVRRVYGAGEPQVVGFKQVWTNEFVPALARTRHDARFVLIQRDPRAVAASKNVKDARYPWLFLARQWRKLAVLSWAYGHDRDLLRDRVLLLNYEDLVAEPEASCARICAFLGLELYPAMTDPARYVDGAGRPWRQNTSYGPGDTGFDRRSLERWRTILSPAERGMIDALCGPEMRLIGYPSEADGTDWRRNPPRIADEHHAGWIKDLYPNDAASLAAALAQEDLRDRLLAASDAEVAATDADTVAGAFLLPQALAALRETHALPRSATA
jgi:hypothetical protein